MSGQKNIGEMVGPNGLEPLTWPSYDGSLWSFAFAKKSVSAGRAGSAKSRERGSHRRRIALSWKGLAARTIGRAK